MLNFFNFEKLISDSNSGIQNRIGSTAHSHPVDLNTSDYHEKCWWTLEKESVSTTIYDGTFSYSNTDANVAGIICTLESIVGALLSLLLIVVLLKNSEIRKEYMTKTVVSIAITDFLFSVFWLPLMSLHYFTRYSIEYLCMI